MGQVQDVDVVDDDQQMVHASGRPTLRSVSNRPTPVLLDDESVADEMPVTQRFSRRTGRPTLARVSGQPTPAIADGDGSEIPVAPKMTKSKRVLRKQSAPTRRSDVTRE
jgi:hypothetical protein